MSRCEQNILQRFFMSNKFPKNDLRGLLCKKSDLVLWEKSGVFLGLKKQLYLHRKDWEIGFVLDVLRKTGCVSKGKKGLVFGCGKEITIPLLAQQEVFVTATDQPQVLGESSSWNSTNQYCSGKEALKKEFEKDFDWSMISDFIEYQEMDMNSLSVGNQKYDFLWSSCSLEHLGSFQNSINFVTKSLDFLKNFGFAIHTTEYNYFDNKSFDDAYNCCFNRDVLMSMFDAVQKVGGYVYPIDFFSGDEPEDVFVDVPPFTFHSSKIKLEEPCGKSHFKLLINDKHTTSLGFIIQKRKIKMF